MERSFGLWELMGFALTSLGGTLLHFLYEWADKSRWIAPFSGVNESTWEHMKLIFWPMLAFAVAESFFFKGRADFWWIKLCGVSLGLALIPILFYTYNGAIGHSPDWVNILIFFISAAVSYVFEYWLYKKEPLPHRWGSGALIILCAFALLFVVYTFRTPKIGLFKDPLTGGYGLYP